VTEDGDYWLFHNCHGGMHIAVGWTTSQAKGNVLDSIAETYAGEGLSASASRRAAYSYHVRLVAGPLTRAEATAAHEAWEAEDWAAALVNARPQVRRSYGLPPRPESKRAG
jgi:hypothetical protein